ncbi:phosphodiesterase [Devosia insulae DS-56]|uniref:Phosphodiesterase n=1 Tax=Devosia insulae DS-56 TaxID=1116389 RepID=A0A1E5XXI2_9HYPH|nr:phosphodiesterase [Devosia insulae]OEO33310.1 phosphodiesterase [Devosia insulae DS-56]
MLIAQLSDPHLCAPGTLYQGLVDSNAMFEIAIARLARLDPAPDLVLLRGDVTEHATAEEYRLARRLLAGIRQPVLAIPGNHDEREAFRLAFADRGYLPASGPLHFAVGSHGPVRVIGLDISVPGQHHGDFDAATAAWLEAVLATEPERPTLLMLHQPPIETGIGFIDAYRCFNGARLAAIVARYPAVERVLCGHVHRHMSLRFAGSLLQIAPSTTTAIALRLAPRAEPASFVEPPALLLHQWRAGAGLVTHHLPIEAGEGPLPFF